MTDTGRISLGKFGEDAACRHLESLGHRIVARNYRISHKEVDIISLHNNDLHFVEVKTKKAPVAADPVLSITESKKHNIIYAAKAFLNSAARKGLPYDLEIFFDVITVVRNTDNHIIYYYPNAYQAIYV